MRFNAGNGLATPSRGQQQQQANFAPAPVVYQPKVQTWSDGSHIQLRYAPRRQRGTGSKTPAPMTPAVIPTHWAGKVTKAGHKERKGPKEAVPDFSQWKKEKRKELRVTGTQRPGEPAVPQGLTPASGTPSASTPAAPAVLSGFKVQQGASGITPVLGGITPVMSKTQGGDMTPFLGGMTPVKPQLGEATPAFPGGAGTPSMGGGEATPFMAAHRVPGYTPQLGGQATPVFPVKAELAEDARFGAATPTLIAAKEESASSGGMTPLPGRFLPGGITPMAFGGVTPQAMPSR